VFYTKNYSDTNICDCFIGQGFQEQRDATVSVLFLAFVYFMIILQPLILKLYYGWQTLFFYMSPIT
jgi:hypothetical protein